MKLNPTTIPQGTRTYLFEEAAHKRFLEQTIHSVLRSRGYQEIVTPPFEYYESAAIGLSEEERNRIIRFNEGDSGRVIALRADITSQAARSAATHLSERPLPLRLCYTGQVFRRARKGKGEQYTLNQSGMEIIGFAGPEADIEIIKSAVSALDALGFADYSLSISHAGFIASFLEGMDESDSEKIKKSLAKKDAPTIREILSASSVEEKRINQIASLTGLYGGAEVFEKALSICDSEENRKPLEELRSIYKTVCDLGMEDKISIDLGEMRGFGYYTGINMELFSPSGIPVGTGGRYDNLVKRFGPDFPAVGFGFDIDGLSEAVRKDTSAIVWHGSDILLCGGAEGDAEELRKAGLTVIEPLKKADESELKSFAEKMDIPHILLGGPGEGNYKWIKTGSNQEKTCGLSDFINGYFAKD